MPAASPSGGTERQQGDSSSKRAARKLGDEQRKLAELVGCTSNTKAAIVATRTVNEAAKWTASGGWVLCFDSDGKFSHCIDLRPSAFQEAIQRLDEELSQEES